MPRLPKGMFRRGRSYYTRDQRGYGDKRINLGQDEVIARQKFREYREKGRTLPRPSTRMTVEAVAQEWLETRVATAFNEKNQKVIASHIRHYLVPFMGKFLVDRVTARDVTNYRKWLDERCKTRSTVHHILGDLRSMLLWCRDSGILERSPFPRRIFPRLQEKPPDRLTPEEEAKVRAICEPYGRVIRLALGTGMRWSELCRAQASDVEAGYFVVQHQTKSGKVRRIPLQPELLQEVRSHIGKLVPFSENSPGSFNKTVRKLSGVARFHVHQTRHTFGCQWLERGGSLAALQELLGHASIVTTQRYARLMDDMIRREAERVWGLSGPNQDQSPKTPKERVS